MPRRVKGHLGCVLVAVMRPIIYLWVDSSRSLFCFRKRWSHSLFIRNDNCAHQNSTKSTFCEAIVSLILISLMYLRAMNHKICVCNICNFFFLFNSQGEISVAGEAHRVILQAVNELYDREVTTPWEAQSERKCSMVFIGKDSERPCTPSVHTRSPNISKICKYSIVLSKSVQWKWFWVTFMKSIVSLWQNSWWTRNIYRIMNTYRYVEVKNIIHSINGTE